MAKGFTAKTLIDMAGFRSGRLMVVYRGPSKPDGTAQWYCKCDCGSDKLTLLTGQNLRNIRTKSCGCLIIEHAKALQKNPPKSLIAYRNRPTPMAKCHPSLPQEAKGLCGTCYNQLKQTYNPERDKMVAKARLQRPENAFTNNESSRWRVLLKHLYKITPEFFNEMMIEQDGVCVCCGLPETAKYRKTKLVKRLQVDHDHNCCPTKKSCGKCIRGLVCSTCNMLLGLAKDNPLILAKLSEYVAAGGFIKMRQLDRETTNCLIGEC